jgi:predicted dehydrogenase
MTRWTYAGKSSWTEQLVSECIDVPNLRTPFELQIEHFARVIRGEETPNCTGSDGLRAVEVCEAIRRSMAEQVPIEVPAEI